MPSMSPSACAQTEPSPRGRGAWPIRRGPHYPVAPGTASLPGGHEEPSVTEQIRVVIVDDIAETREHLPSCSPSRSDIEVVGAAVIRRGGRRDDRAAQSRHPAHGHQHAGHGRHRHRRSASRRRCPATSIIMMSVQGEADYLRRSMLAGAREFLVKPFSSDELTASIRQVHVRENAEARTHGRRLPGQRHRRPPTRGTRNGKIVTLFAPKGGVGRTTLAVNLAVALAGEQRQVRRRSSTAPSSSATSACCSTSTPRTSRSSTSWPIPAPRRRGPRRHHAHQPQHGHQGAAGAAQPGDGRAHHGRAHPPHDRPPARHERLRRRRPVAALQRRRRWRSSTCPTSSSRS